MVTPLVMPPNEFNLAKPFPYPRDSLPQPNTIVANPLRLSGYTHYAGYPNAVAAAFPHYEDPRQSTVYLVGAPYDVSVLVDPGPMRMHLLFTWIHDHENIGGKVEFFVDDIYVLTPPS
ncbi:MULTISPECIES: hypothetical protein [unclassified Pseudomonas]|uniref:hypothetical protein n=1 Tax=unclassified Pseudomonas TaxID=196821 RepID=UPI001CBF31D1|nr:MULTISPECIES: hypothetical protein [unclassified Pseudomonas]